MTKANLIDHVAEATKGTKKDTEQVIDAVFASVTEALVKGDKVDLRGFGSFQVSGKKERQGRNPRTGEAMTIAARNVAAFKPGKELSGRLNGGSENELATTLQPTQSLNPSKVPRKYTLTSSTPNWNPTMGHDLFTPQFCDSSTGLRNGYAATVHEWPFNGLAALLGYRDPSSRCA
jgi:DNA-binding protein HU-beta